MIVDFHTHIMPEWVRDDREHYVAIDAGFATLYSDPKATLSTAEDLLASMDESSIDVSVILNIGWTTHEMCVRTNDYLLEAASRHPDRLIAFCAIQPASPDEASQEVERCAASGARGIGELRPDIQGFSLTDSALLYPVVEAAISQHMILLTHVSEPVGHRYPGKGTITPEQAYALAGLFPQVTLVCAHWGGGLPFYHLMPEVRETLNNVYFDTAATQYLYDPRIFSIVDDLAGPTRILFGSDYPLIRQKRAVDHAAGAIMKPETRDMVMAGNAVRLLSLEEKAA
ncbi:MAG: amidohydrolase family protein [Dehalococcoidia bacterium]|nr:amidohydrolase family protein [Dehalococcoidia bacterium]